MPCYNTAMQIILPFIPIVLGILGGLLVNFVVDWLYVRREVYTVDQQTDMLSRGWLGYLLWPWGCASCENKKKIRVQTVNLVALIFALWIFNQDKIEIWWGFPLWLLFMVIVVTDLEYKVIFLPVSYAGGALGLLIGIFTHGLLTTVLGGLAGFGLMFVFYKLGEMFTRAVARGRGADFDEIALGFGDVYVSGIIGLVMGWPGVFAGLFLGILFGGIVSLFLITVKKISGKFEAFEAIPYAPFLVAGAVLLIYFRDVIYYYW